MKIYDYIIYGAGPTGMTLAYLLAKNNKSVCLVEKEDKIGGCWKVEWKNGKYFTEHAPRVLLENNSSFFKLLYQIGFNYKNETVSTYGTLFETNKKILYFFWKHLKLSDYLKIISGTFNLKNLTVSEWLDKINISESGRKAFTIFSILLANSPDKLLVSELFESSSFPVMFLQFIDNEKWINLLANELVKLKVDIFLHHSLDKLMYDITNDKITQGIILNSKTWKGKGHIILFGNNHILTFPPKAMANFLETQTNIVRNNWKELQNDKLYKWLDNSTYYSFGFQLHFKDKINLQDKEWCWSCMNDYNLILLPTSQYQKEFTKNKDIKTVWSCTIVDTSKFIKKFNKTINEMSKDEIINDILNILNVKPDKITFYDGLQKKKVNRKVQWISKDSAFSVGKSGIVKSKGYLKNLEWIGPHNTIGVTVINKAVNIAVNWIKNKDLNTFNLENNSSYFIEIVTIIFIIYFIYKYNDY